jgi:uncharacterized protein (DUF1501 family)
MNDHMTTRRIFLQKGLTLLAVTPTIPTFLDQTVLALANPEDLARTQHPSGTDGKILVIVQLSGGNDGLNTIIPFADDAYHKARPSIRHEKGKVLKIDDYISLHPNLAPLKELYDNAQMSIIQGVGYPNPNRSHFRSMDIWHSAAPEKEVVTSGWLGRYFDNACPGCDPHAGLALGDTMPLAMKGERVMPLSFERPDNYQYNGPDKGAYAALNKHANTDPASQPSMVSAGPKDRVASSSKKSAIETVDSQKQMDFLTRTAMDAQVSSDTILRVTKQFQPAAQYPGNEFGSGLRTVAAMITGGMPTRVYYVSLGGFDTHAGERGRHDQLMQQLASGVSAFWADMKATGNADRVLMMTFSEFGRRVQQNASGGTDHGAAAPMFLFGPAVKTGLAGKHPSLTDLDQGDLKYTTDFRSVYASVLQNWLETPSKPILGAQFPTLPIIKG